MIKRQKWLIIIFAAVFAVLLAAYLIFSALNRSVEEPVPAELLDGEVLEADGSISMFEQIERVNIARLDVFNSFGSFAFYQDTDGDFYIEGKEGAPYDESALSALITAAGYTRTLYRVMKECDDLSAYGLAAEQDPAYYVLRTRNDKVFKVFIGDAIPSDGGYYCRLDGRDALYVLDATIADSLLVPASSLITPILGYTLPASTFFEVSDFYVEHNGEKTIEIGYTPDTANLADRPSNSVFTMSEPKGYVVNELNYYSVLEKFQDFEGDQTLEFGKFGEAMPEETLAAYGLDDPEYVVRYVYEGIDSVIRLTPTGKVVGNGEDTGYYFAYSELWNLIALVDGSKVSFLNWNTIMYVAQQVFLRNIDDISRIEIESPAFSEVFLLHNAGSALSVAMMSDGRTLPQSQIVNFRQFYKTMLTLGIEDYTESEALDDKLMSLKITTDDGYEFLYEFYGYSTRRCFMTLNGEGEFYCLRDIVDKIISDARRVVNGDDVDSWGKN